MLRTLLLYISITCLVESSPTFSASAFANGAILWASWIVIGYPAWDMISNIAVLPDWDVKPSFSSSFLPISDGWIGL